MHYFITDQGGWMSVSGDTDVLGVIPDRYREVTADEFYQVAGIIRVELPQEPLAAGSSA